MALKYLILHESPTEARTVNKFLPKEYFAMSTWGHFMETSSKKLDIDKEKWELNWKLSGDKKKKDNLKKIGEKIKEALSNGGQVIIATDPDREGAVIASEIVKYFKLKKGDYIVHGKVTDLNKDPYLKGIKNHFKDLDWNLVESGLARQILDKLVGFELTEFLWSVSRNYKPYLEKTIKEIDDKVANFELKNKTLIEKNKTIKDIVDNFKKLDFKELYDFKKRLGISFGRVQSSALCLLVDKELLKFDKELERKINIFAKDDNNKQWSYAENAKYEANIEHMQKVYNELAAPASVEVVDIVEEVKNISPLVPLDTQLAQSGINSAFGYSIKKIMSILQDLYEAGYTTYMRTDTNAVPESYQKHIKDIIESNATSGFHKRIIKEDENAQGGHEGILPTKNFDLNNLPATKSKEHEKVLEYIIRRSSAYFMKDAKIKYYTYYIKVNGYDFILKDTDIIEEGFIEIFNYLKEKYSKKINYNIGDTINISEFIFNEKSIKLPGGYTEGTLVKELKKLGIGRPSTWETIIETLKKKEYITLKKSKIEVTPKGYYLKTIIDSGYFKEFPKSDYTSKMENALDDIVKGKIEKNKLLDKVNSEIIDIKGVELPKYDAPERKSKEPVSEPKAHLGTCPSCKKGFIEKKEVNGKTVHSCNNWKAGCKFTIWQAAAQHVFTEKEIQDMIKNQRTELIEDFVSRKGTNFSAYYVFTKGKGFGFEFENNK